MMNQVTKVLMILFIINNTFLANINAQTQLVVSGGNLVMNGNSLVLENTKFINNGNFNSSSGEVIILGDAVNGNSEIGGSSLTIFYNLTINKTSNGTQLGNDINVFNQLTLASGNIDIQDADLIIRNTGTISGGSSSSYIQTSSLGTLVREVNASNITFPIGNQSYTPAILNNAGTADDFNVRVENVVYLDGTSGNPVTTDVVNATWYINEATAGGSNVAATFQWNASDELTNFDRTQSFASYYNNSIWNNGTVQAASGSNPYTLTENGISTFSQFVVGSDANVLPVELLYFYAEKQEKSVLLNWETAAEIDNDYFDIEWSIDGINFEKIGQTQGAGNSNSINSYDFFHRLPASGLNYYRLKQVDFDGKFEYTNIVLVTFEEANNSIISIYPNPASHYLKIESRNIIDEPIQIYNIKGQLIKEFQQQSLSTNLLITDLPSGTYFVKIENEITKITIQK